VIDCRRLPVVDAHARVRCCSPNHGMELPNEGSGGVGLAPGAADISPGLRVRGLYPSLEVHREDPHLRTVAVTGQFAVADQ